MAGTKSAGAKNIKNFEAALARLEEITAELEAGELPLEESIDRFAEGMELARFCNATLEEARGRIELLLADKGGDKNGPIESRPFYDEEEGGAPKGGDRLPF